MFGDYAMKVFLSWSGELSQKIAEFLKKWLEQCIQSVEVFYSAEDIEKGETWHAKLSNELRDTNYGIVCLTDDNVNAPWIHFEAGALSKMLDARVATLAVNVNFSDIKGPLSTFQATKLEKDDMYKLLKSINESQEKQLTEEKLKNSFEAFWPKFNDEITLIKKSYTTLKDDKKQTKVNVSESVDEILQLVRGQSAIINDPTKLIPEDYIRYVMKDASFDSRKVDEFFDALYMYTKRFISEQYDDKDVNEVRPFIRNYMDMVYALCREYPKWMSRFSRMFREYRHRYINDETDI